MILRSQFSALEEGISTDTLNLDVDLSVAESSTDDAPLRTTTLPPRPITIAAMPSHKLEPVIPPRPAATLTAKPAVVSKPAPAVTEKPTITSDKPAVTAEKSAPAVALRPKPAPAARPKPVIALKSDGPVLVLDKTAPGGWKHLILAMI